MKVKLEGKGGGETTSKLDDIEVFLGGEVNEELCVTNKKGVFGQKKMETPLSWPPTQGEFPEGTGHQCFR